MGRYYFGDIEGKFMFAVQPSDAADRFGVTGVSPSELYYYFNKENDLENVVKELTAIENLWGKDLKHIQTFFSKVDLYTDESILEFLLFINPNFDKKNINKLLSDYADYELGCKIKDCLLQNEYCNFTAEG